MKKKLNHISELDGARGIAIMIVMLYHFMHVPMVSDKHSDYVFTNVLYLGWIGVDLFFVLSGFLITRILIQSKELQRFSDYIKSFYKKRVLRIFPLYYLYLAFIFFVFSPVVLPYLDGIEKERLLRAKADEPWFWLYVSNIKQVLNGTFYGASVGHLWSLSIEEQFYLIWPFIIFFFRMETVKKITIGVVIFTPILRILLWYKGITPISIYVFTLTRIDALTMGSLIAIVAMQEKVTNYQRLLYFFISLLIVSLCSIYFFGVWPNGHPFVYTIGYSMLALTFGSLILLLQSSYTGRIKSFFRSRFLVFMGKYSYALYMFHPLVRNVMLRLMGTPKLIFGNQLLWNLAFIIACTTLSIVIALASWNLFEKWFLKLKNKIESDPTKKLVTT